MHEGLIKQLRELQAITEHCDEQSCGECENRELCDKHDNKTLSGTYKEAADAIEHMQKTILRLENELGVYDDLPMVDQSMVLSKMEKTTEPPKEKA